MRGTTLPMRSCCKDLREAIAVAVCPPRSRCRAGEDAGAREPPTGARLAAVARQPVHPQFSPPCARTVPHGGCPRLHRAGPNAPGRRRQHASRGLGGERDAVLALTPQPRLRRGRVCTPRASAPRTSVYSTMSSPIATMSERGKRGLTPLPLAATTAMRDPPLPPLLPPLLAAAAAPMSAIAPRAARAARRIGGRWWRACCECDGKRRQTKRAEVAARRGAGARGLRFRSPEAHRHTGVAVARGERRATYKPATAARHRGVRRPVVPKQHALMSRDEMRSRRRWAWSR